MSASSRSRSSERWALVAALVAACLGVCGVAVAGSPGTATITTVAGTGTPGFSGDGGQAISAELHTPFGVAVDPAGNLLIADTGNGRVRLVSPGGLISTLVAPPAATLILPHGVAVDPAGSVLIANTYNLQVLRVSPAGVVTTVAGTGLKGSSGDGGPATSAKLSFPYGVAVDSAGNVFIADTFNRRVRRVSSGGVITTVAGTGKRGFSGDGGPATSAQLDLPYGVAVDAAGNLFIADTANHRVRRVSPDGVITTVVGTGVAGFSGDGGPATSAQLNRPTGVAVDAAGNLYIADALNNRVRRVSPDGVITTVAGTAQKGFSGDGGQATSAQLNEPSGVAVDSAGNLYIADSGNNRVRKVAGLSPAAPAAPAPPDEEPVAAPPAAPDAGAAPPADTEIEAAVIGAVGTRSRLGLRVVRVELDVEERLTARLVLLRKGATLASKRFASVRPGSRVLTLAVPRRVTKGKATLRIELSDAAGNTRAMTRRVMVPVVGRAPSVAARSVLAGAVCGTFQAAGATWGAKTTGVSCATAKRIVRQLAGKTAPLPGGRYPGRYAGMTCGGIVPGAKPRIITCTGEGRQVVAGRK